MRSSRLVAVAVLAVVLALSSAQNASATIEISYDDGTPERGMGNPANQYMAVRFSLPFAPARLVMARFWSRRKVQETIPGVLSTS